MQRSFRLSERLCLQTEVIKHGFSRSRNGAHQLSLCALEFALMPDGQMIIVEVPA
jgi:hypothetical protein